MYGFRRPRPAPAPRHGHRDEPEYGDERSHQHRAQPILCGGKGRRPGIHSRPFVPPQLAYGERGVPGRTAGTTVGPNEALIFDLELLAIKQAGPVSGQPVAAKAKSRKD